MRSSRRGDARERTREFTSKPAHFGTAKRRRIEQLSYPRDPEGSSGVLHLPSFVVSSLSRGSSLSHSNVLSFTRRSPPVSLSRSLSAFARTFPRTFSPPSPSNRPSSPSTADTKRAYACVHVVTTYYYALLLILAYYYEQWRIDDLSSRPSSCEQPRDFFRGIFGRVGKETRTRRRRDLCTLFPSSFLEKLPLQCAPNLDGELLRIYFIY